VTQWQLHIETKVSIYSHGVALDGLNELKLNVPLISEMLFPDNHLACFWRKWI